MATPHEDRSFNTIRNSAVDKRAKNRTVQHYTVFAVAALFALTIVVLLVMAIGGIIDNVGDHPKPPNEKVDWGTLTVTSSDTLTGNLVLVNNTHVYTFPSTIDHLGKLNDMRLTHDPRVYKQSGLSTYMEKTALSALDSMLVDFHAATGKDNVILKYAYRSAEDQQALVDAGASTQVGYSDHHTGLGIQLGYSKDGRTYELSTDPTYNWLFENCHKYGFVIRYPANKVDLTGVSDYTEYFRYVGVPHATYMKANDLCLEEYIEVLKGYTYDKPLTIAGADGKSYQVYYVAVDGSASVKYPTNYAYSISGTNAGGVVITVDRSQVLTPEENTTDTSANTSNAS